VFCIAENDIASASNFLNSIVSDFAVLEQSNLAKSID